MTEIEKGITVNTSLLFLANVSYRNGKVLLTNPTDIFLNSSDMVTDLNKKLIKNFGWTMAFGGICLFSVYQLLLLLRKDAVIFIEKKKQQRLRDKIQKMDTILVTKLECIICCENIRNVIALPCNHIYACSMCFEKFKGKYQTTCSICKAELTGTAKLHFC